MRFLSRLKFFPLSHGVTLAVVLSFLALIILFWPDQNSLVKEEEIILSISDDASTLIPDPLLEWEVAQVQAGDSLSVLFNRHKLSAANIVDIVNTAPKEALKLQPNQELRWIRSANDRLLKLHIVISPLASHSFERQNENEAFTYQLAERDAEYRPHFVRVTIDNSLFVDGLRAGIPEQALIDMANIFGWDIDFALDIQPGDHYSLIYEEIFLDGKRIGTGKILATQFSNKGRLLTAIRYTNQKGQSDYYTPQGKSMRKEFLRNPIDFTRISSRFTTARKHPVLQSTIRAHRGTDYAAPTGTPIKASGDGKVVFAGKKSGYGNTIILQHGAQYRTLYAHLSRFNKNTKTGRFVKQGQVIGYVGMTGLATGPHLHYEFQVNGVHRDPLKVALPQAQAIAKEYLSDFLEHSENMINWLGSFNDSATAISGHFQ